MTFRDVTGTSREGARVSGRAGLGRGALAALVWAALSPAQAQTSALPSAPNAFIEELRQRERERALRDQQEPVASKLPEDELPGAPLPPTERLPTDEQPCYRVDTLVIDGTQAADLPWLRASLDGERGDDGPIGRCLGAQGNDVLLRRLQRVLVQRGWVASVALVNLKASSNGVLNIAVFPGRLGTIRFAEGSSPGTALSNAIPLKPGEVIDLRATEQGLENLKRVPGAEAKIGIAPARDAKPEDFASDLVVSYAQARHWRGSLSLDDSGTKATGRTQGGVTLSGDNLLGLNDLFYVSANHSVDEKYFISAPSRGTEAQVLHYSLPYGYWLASATASKSRYRQSIAGFGEDIIYAGRSSNAELKLSRVVYRDQRGRTAIGVRAFRSKSHSFIDDTEVKPQRRLVAGWEFGVSHRQFAGEATLDANLAYRRGTGAFGSLRAPDEAYGEGTSRLALVAADVGVNAPFQFGAQKLRYIGLLRAQWNRTPLTPQDRFGIGGRYSVRGFDGEASLLADRGWFLRNEIGLALGQSGAELYGGADYGTVGGPSAQYLIGRHLAGGVIGLRGAFKSFSYDVFLGAPIRKPEGFRTARVTAGFNLNYSF